jgi:hypothetical protein
MYKQFDILTKIVFWLVFSWYAENQEFDMARKQNDMCQPFILPRSSNNSNRFCFVIYVALSCKISINDEFEVRWSVLRYQSPFACENDGIQK